MVHYAPESETIVYRMENIIARLGFMVFQVMIGIAPHSHHVAILSSKIILKHIRKWREIWTFIADMRNKACIAAPVADDRGNYTNKQEKGVYVCVLISYPSVRTVAYMASYNRFLYDTGLWTFEIVCIW